MAPINRKGTNDNATTRRKRVLLMNGLFDSVEMKMLEELAKKGAVTNKRFSDKKKYLKELVRRLYLNL